MKLVTIYLSQQNNDQRRFTIKKIIECKNNMKKTWKTMK